MCAKRRECRLVNKDYKEIDLTQYSKIIIDTINNTVSGKNPVVEKDRFSTDLLSHRERIRFYNNERIQTKTKLTPLEKRSQYVA